MCYCDVAEFIERGIFICSCAVNCVLFSLSETIALVLASYNITRWYQWKLGLTGLRYKGMST